MKWNNEINKVSKRNAKLHRAATILRALAAFISTGLIGTSFNSIRLTYKHKQTEEFIWINYTMLSAGEFNFFSNKIVLY